MTAAEIATTIANAIRTSIRENRIVRVDAEECRDDYESAVYAADGYEDSTWTQDVGGDRDVLDAWGTTEDGHEWRIEIECV